MRAHSDSAELAGDGVGETVVNGESRNVGDNLRDPRQDAPSAI
jgi:hypothetical protein